MGGADKGHTMISFGVRPEKEEELRERMEGLGIRECDLEETFIRGSGPGGQNVNKVATCVRLRHAPSGVEVKCGKERSQLLNRFFARRQLCDAIEGKLDPKNSQRVLAAEKIRKQKARRKRRAGRSEN